MTVTAFILAGPALIGGYLAVAAVLFALGVLACTTRRNAVGFLMGIEMMLNAAALNFAAFDRFRVGTAAASAGQGQIMALFIIALAAAESAVALAMVYSVYRTWRDIDLAATSELKG
jgi:NADH-quinone oxidoreductase subunit K